MSIEDEMFEAAGPNDQQLLSITEMATELADIDGEVIALEQQLKEVKARKNEIEFGELPEAMNLAGLDEIKLRDGRKITSKFTVRGSLPKDPEKRHAALEWFRDKGHEDLIKNQITVTLEKGQDNLAGSFVAQMEEAGLFVERKEDINHMTLCAFAREQIQNGEDVPVETLGLWSGNQAKVKKGK